MKKTIQSIILASALTTGVAFADSYKLDSEGRHAFVNFKVSHLGYSFVTGTFSDLSGSFDYDSKTNELSNVKITVQTDSVNTTHAERDKHLRGKDFLAVSKYPEATFISKSFSDGQLTGDLTIHGVTKSVTVPITKIGEGKDPWDGYRAGFMTSITIPMKDFGIKKDLGPASANVELNINFEGIKQ